MGANPGRLALPILFALASCVFLTGIQWGLPSRSADAFLFGGTEPWSGQKIVTLAGGWEEHAHLAADVAMNPLARRDTVLVLNDTDAKRAEIIRRYRLFSYQPDEMITLRALAGMKPRQGQLDPKLYQYGGLWVYPVGALLQTASKLGFVQLRPDVAWYLDHPEAFGRFYVVARFYAALWGLVGVVAVYRIVARIVGGWIFPSSAALCFMLMPVVVNAAHEAKPHLPGAVLMLLAALAGARYVETGTRRAWLSAGALCGAAVGMVLTSLPVMLILPGMVVLRPIPWRERVRIVLLTGLLATGVYLATNPYVGINLLWHRDILRSNFGNNFANGSSIYHRGGEGSALADGCWLIAAGMSPVLAIVGAAGALALGRRAMRVRDRTDRDAIRRRATGLLLALPAAAGAAQFFAFAAGKQAEYARFALFPDIFLAIEAVVGVATFVRGSFSVSIAFDRQRKGSSIQGFKSSRVGAFERLNPSTPEPSMASHTVRSNSPRSNPPPQVRDPILAPVPDREAPSGAFRSTHTSSAGVVVLACVILATAIPGLRYVRGFARDSRPETSRIAAARLLQSQNEHGARTLALWAEPAPHSVPPMDLFGWKVLLPPAGTTSESAGNIAEVSVRTADGQEERTWRGLFSSTPVSWADKSFDLQVTPEKPAP
ncbi:MAG TPA: glycosyltransferase family 39 protein [Tepidisphaeraceae bacterium]|jgi:hypothetical protein|nr:glycosyltransferase family 39 protein [Tepidisphaeraceae bacterium]